MLIKFSVIDEVLHVQDGDDVIRIWRCLKNTREASDEMRSFFLNNFLFSIKIE
jgi:hypothetical protein